MTGKEYRVRMKELQAQMAALKREFFGPIVDEYRAKPGYNINALAREHDCNLTVLMNELRKADLL